MVWIRIQIESVFSSRLDRKHWIKADITGSGVDLRGGTVDPLQGGDEEAAGRGVSRHRRQDLPQPQEAPPQRQQPAPLPGAFLLYITRPLKGPVSPDHIIISRSFAFK